MKDFFVEQKTNISQHKWSLEYNLESHTANFVNEHGESMDLSTLGYCLEALRNEAYDLKEKKYGSQRTIPLDDLSKRRQGIVEYNLISDRVMATRDILEAYGDINGVLPSINSKFMRTEELKLKILHYIYFTLKLKS